MILDMDTQRREVALLGGAYDGSVRVVSDDDAFIVMPPKHQGDESLVYRRALEIDGIGRPVFVLEGLNMRCAE